MTKILLVEDDVNLADLTRRALVSKGYVVIIAREALKAIEKAKEQKPNLILMDIMLPGISGGEAVRELKKDPDLMDIPVIFLTALISNEKDEENMVTVDGCDYKTLGKPYKIRQLLDVIESVAEPRG